jgi:hypothetical protein
MELALLQRFDWWDLLVSMVNSGNSMNGVTEKDSKLPTAPKK